MQLSRPLVAGKHVTEPQEMEILLFALSLRGLPVNSGRDGTDKHGLCVLLPGFAKDRSRSSPLRNLSWTQRAGHTACHRRGWRKSSKSLCY